VGGSHTIKGKIEKMNLEFHNTLTSKKEIFNPLVRGKVGMYVCGITPYDETHLGHARCYVVFDILKRVLEKNGYDVMHIQNFTDVDDKIIVRAIDMGVSPDVYAEPFIQSFHTYMGQLNVKPASVYPRVTTHMKEIIQIIERLILRGLAYELNGSVYYEVRKFSDYGKLSKRKIDELESGARVEVDELKRDPLDFALWKNAKKGEPAWDSPWGPGRPGWHIECSAMSMKYLGEEFDIHGGGQDLIFPHHENEIAQSVGASARAFAKIWIHNGFVTVNQEKMSKSLGNFFTLKDILAKFDPMVVRYFLLGQHYRTPLDFSAATFSTSCSCFSRAFSYSIGPQS
jgi:cysteinyl-tRNA synthetase